MGKANELKLAVPGGVQTRASFVSFRVKGGSSKWLLDKTCCGPYKKRWLRRGLAEAEGAMQIVYTYSGRDVAESRRTLATMVRNEFTDGDLDVEPAGEVRSFIRKGLSQPITFMRSVNGTGISFRRCWHHIHARKAAVR